MSARGKITVLFAASVMALSGCGTTATDDKPAPASHLLRESLETDGYSHIYRGWERNGYDGVRAIGRISARKGQSEYFIVEFKNKGDGLGGSLSILEFAERSPRVEAEYLGKYLAYGISRHGTISATEVRGFSRAVAGGLGKRALADLPGFELSTSRPNRTYAEPTEP